jgi:5-hydroxyisourate hydrolase-like protein (transthyretin family)
MSSSCVDAPDDYVGETSIRGIVERQGKPAEGAYVRLTGSQDEFVAEQRTTEDGRFRFWVVPGDWTVICLAPGADRLTQTVSLAKGRAVDVKFDLEPAATAAG